MNKIYQAIADLRSDFKTMSFAFTKDENEIDNAVQELMLYFMQYMLQKYHILNNIAYLM